MRYFLIIFIVTAYQISAGGRKAPDISLPFVNQKGSYGLFNPEKIMVVDFWATWCPPCRESLPRLEQIQKQYPSADFVAVNLDNDEKVVKKFLKKYGLDLIVVHDIKKQAAEAFKVAGMPSIFLIVNGEIIWAKHGYTEKDMQDLVSKLSEVTSENS